MHDISSSSSGGNGSDGGSNVSKAAAAAPGATPSATTTAQVRRSAANYVRPPPKIQLLARFSQFYSTRIPMGVREFVFMGPMMLAMAVLAYFAPSYLPMDKFTQGLQPPTDDMRTYVLEPVYDEHGELRAYRRIYKHRAQQHNNYQSDKNGTESVNKT